MIHVMITLGLAFIILWIIAKKLSWQPKSIQGKVVLITGSANGIGRALVKKYAELGCRVVCVDVDDKNNETIVEEINSKCPGTAKAYSCNIAVAEEIQKLKEQVQKDFGTVNILVNNAIISYYNSSPVEYDQELLNAAIAVNMTGQILMANAFLPDMLKCNDGHVVAISSMAAWHPTRQFGIYAATKTGNKSYMESLAFKLEDIPNNKVDTTIAYLGLANTHPLITERFENTFKAMTPDYAACAIVRGVLKGRKEIFIPHGFRYASGLLSLLPFKLRYKIMKKYEPDFGFLTEEARTEYRLDSIVPATNQKIANNIHRTRCQSDNCCVKLDLNKI